jgi:hypothetical protein
MRTYVRIILIHDIKRRRVLVQYLDIKNSNAETMYTLIEKVLDLPEEVFDLLSELLIRDKGGAEKILGEISKDRVNQSSLS